MVKLFLKQILKILKNSILLEISSNYWVYNNNAHDHKSTLLHVTLFHVHEIEGIMKPCTGPFVKFWSNFKNLESAQTFYTTYIEVYVYVSEKIIKMKNSLLAIFDKIWSKTLYYSTWLWPNF